MHANWCTTGLTGMPCFTKEKFVSHQSWNTQPGSTHRTVCLTLAPNPLLVPTIIYYPTKVWVFNKSSLITQSEPHHAMWMFHHKCSHTTHSHQPPINPLTPSANPAHPPTVSTPLPTHAAGDWAHRLSQSLPQIQGCEPQHGHVSLKKGCSRK